MGGNELTQQNKEAANLGKSRNKNCNTNKNSLKKLKMKRVTWSH